MENEFNNQVIIITGGAGGIGSDCAKEFAKCGAKVAIVDFNEELGNKVVNEIKDLKKSISDRIKEE